MTDYLENEPEPSVEVQEPTIPTRPSLLSTITPVHLLTGGGILVGFIIIYFLSTVKWALIKDPFFGGFFNNTLFGIQYYVFFIPVAIIMYLIAYIWWAKLKWGGMLPFQGLWFALNAGTEVVFVTDLRLNFSLLSEAMAKLVFDKERYNKLVLDTDKWYNRVFLWIKPIDQAVSLAKFLQGSWDSKPMTNIGPVPAGILLDAFGWTKPVSPQREAIRVEVDLHNDKSPDDQIHAFSKAWEYMEKGIINTPKGVELYVTVPWVRIDNAYPKKRFEAERGGFIRQLAENIARGDYSHPPVSMTMAGAIVFVCCVFFSGLMFMFRFVWVAVPK
jgi:hypothetical protein